MTLDPAMLLYTYISRFSVNPHYIRSGRAAATNAVPNRSSSRFSASRTNGPRSLSRGESGLHTRLSPDRIAHSGTHGETGGVWGGGWYHYPRSVPHVSETLRGQGVERQTLPLLGLGRGCSRRTQKACGTAMRLCVSLSRRRRGPAGLLRGPRRDCVNDKKYDQSVGWFIFDFLLGKCKFSHQKGCFTALLIRRNRWLPIFQPRLVDFWRAFW